MQLVECVPNFSEGRDHKVIDAITAAMAAVEGVTVLDVDPGAATNRTVYTMVGPPDGVAEAAFQAIRTGLGLIDMTKHSGAHPRQGACLAGVDFADAGVRVGAVQHPAVEHARQAHVVGVDRAPRHHLRPVDPLLPFSNRLELLILSHNPPPYIA